MMVSVLFSSVSFLDQQIKSMMMEFSDVLCFNLNNSSNKDQANLNLGSKKGYDSC